MFPQLPDDLQELLKELSECGDIIDKNQYTPEQIRLLEKLCHANLVALSYRLTVNGKAYVKQLR